MTTPRVLSGLEPRFTPGAGIENSPDGWRLQIPIGGMKNYRLAQLDDYGHRNRNKFPHNPGISLKLKARASTTNIHGTWGFGFWNDPFAFSLGLQGGVHKLPALPNACWFFYASPENHLSFQQILPGHGFLAQSFRSPQIPPILLLPGLLAAPFLLIKAASKWLRKQVNLLIQSDGLELELDATQWHDYQIDWQSTKVTFTIDGRKVCQTRISPRGPLGVVLWIDNQFAAWSPDGRLSAGTLENTLPAWLEITELEICELSPDHQTD